MSKDHETHYRLFESALGNEPKYYLVAECEPNGSTHEAAPDGALRPQQFADRCAHTKSRGINRLRLAGRA